MKSMKTNHLTYRLITAVWLGALCFLFVLSQIIFDPHVYTRLLKILLIAAPLFGIIMGFFWGYRVLLLSADKLYQFPLRCVAGIWTGSCTYLLLFGFKINSINIFSLIAVVGFLLGFCVFYKIFLWPKLDYLKSYPGYLERIISAIYFGFFGFLVSWPFLVHQDVNVNLIFGFIALLSAYLGFYHGYRVLLLPNSFKGLIKSLMLGIVGASYISMISLFIISLAVIFISVYSPKNFSFHDLVTVNFLILFVMFPAMSLLISAMGGVISMILYLLSRIWVRRISIGQSP
jgi:hypothetical protein